MNDSGEKRAVLITGCDSGFGYSLALRTLLSKKYDWIVFAGCYQPGGDLRGSNSLVQLAEKASRRDWLHVIPLDVTRQESVEAAEEKVEKVLKEKNAKLWAVVNNAASLVFADAAFQTVSQVRRQYDVNVIGAWYVSRAFLPHLIASGGRIVNMTSFCSECPLPTLSLYTSSKAALLSLGNGMRMELARMGVDVIAFNPGDHPFETSLCCGQATHYEEMRQGVETRFRDHPDVRKYFKASEGKFTLQFQEVPLLKQLDNPGLYYEFEKILTDTKPKPEYINSNWMTRIYFGTLRALPVWLGDLARIALMRLPK